MYAYEFKPKRRGINYNEIFVVMPFEEKYEGIYSQLIISATEKANVSLAKKGFPLIKPHRTKEDITTTSGWINVLEHLFTAQVVLGVLTDNNANVFYELGIAHATQPISRQILLANKGYLKKFDTKDLIYFEYDEEKLESGIDLLAKKIEDAILTSKLEQEKLIHRSRMMVGPCEFEIIMNYGRTPNFVIHASRDGLKGYKEIHGEETTDIHVRGMTNLCHNELLALNTKLIDPKISLDRLG